MVVKAGQRFVQFLPVLRCPLVNRVHLDQLQRALHRLSVVNILLRRLQPDLGEIGQVITTTEDTHQLKQVAVPVRHAHSRAGEQLAQIHSLTGPIVIQLKDGARTAIAQRVGVLADHSIHDSRPGQKGDLGIRLVGGDDVRNLQSDKEKDELSDHFLGHGETLCEHLQRFLLPPFRNQLLSFFILLQALSTCH